MLDGHPATDPASRFRSPRWWVRLKPSVVHADSHAQATHHTSMASLTDYAPANPSGQCAVCALPPNALAQITANRAADPRRFTWPVIADWLTNDQGVPVSRDQLSRHFRGHPR